MEDYSNLLGCFFLVGFFIWTMISISLLIKIICQNSKIYVLFLKDYKEKIMPMVKGAKARTKKGFSENIRREKEAHPEMPTKQAVAIAYSVASKSKKSPKKK